MVKPDEHKRGAAAGSSGQGDGSPIPPIKNPAVPGARARRNYRLPWVLLGLALLALVLMVSQCGRDEGKINEAVARDRTMQQQAAAGARADAASGPVSFRQGTLAYDVNQYLISNARREQAFPIRRVGFAPGNALFSDADQTDVAELAQVLRQRPGVRAAVAGYGDGPGDGTAGTRLGAERAVAIIEGLKQRGVDTSGIEARSGQAEAGSRGGSGPAEFILLSREAS